MHQRIAHQKIKQIRSHLKKGGIIAYATESCFGFGVLPSHPQAIIRLLRLKQRSFHKGFIVIGSHIKQFYSFIKPLSLSESSYLEHNWPGAITYLVPAKTGIFPLLRAKQNKKLAIRIPDHGQALSLCQAIQSALISTSANISHQKSCRTLREIKRQFQQKVLIIPGQIGHYKNSSQILDLSTLQKLR